MFKVSETRPKSPCSVNTLIDNCIEAKYTDDNRPDWTWTLNRYTEIGAPPGDIITYPDMQFSVSAISMNMSRIVGNNKPVQFNKINNKTHLEEVINYEANAINEQYDPNNILRARITLHNAYINFEDKYDNKTLYKKVDINSNYVEIKSKTDRFSNPEEIKSDFYSSAYSFVDLPDQNEENINQEVVFNLRAGIDDLEHNKINKDIKIYLTKETYATLVLDMRPGAWFDELNIGSKDLYTKSGITIGKEGYKNLTWHIQAEGDLPTEEKDKTTKENLSISARTDKILSTNNDKDSVKVRDGSYKYEETDISDDMYLYNDSDKTGYEEGKYYYHGVIKDDRFVKKHIVEGTRIEQPITLKHISGPDDYDCEKISPKNNTIPSNGQIVVRYYVKTSGHDYSTEISKYELQFTTKDNDNKQYIYGYDEEGSNHIYVTFTGFEEKIKRYQNNQNNSVKLESLKNYLENSISDEELNNLYNKYEILDKNLDSLVNYLSEADLKNIGFSLNSETITETKEDVCIFNALDFKYRNNTYLYVKSHKYSTPSAKSRAVFQYLYNPYRQKPEIDSDSTKSEINKQNFDLIADTRINLAQFFEPGNSNNNSEKFHSLGDPYGEYSGRYNLTGEKNKLINLRHQSILPETVECYYTDDEGNIIETIYDKPDLGTGTGVKQGLLEGIGDIFYDSGHIRFTSNFEGKISYRYRLADGIAVPYTFRFYNSNVQKYYAKLPNKNKAPNDGVYNMDYNVGIMICAAPANRVNFSYDFLDVKNNILMNSIVPDLILMKQDNLMIGNLKYVNSQNTDGWCRCFKYKWQITRKDINGNDVNIIIKEGFVESEEDDYGSYTGRLDKVDNIIKQLPSNVAMDLYIEPGFYFGNSLDDASKIYTRFSVKIPKQFIKIDDEDLLPKLIFPRPTSGVDMMLPTIERYGYEFLDVIADNWDKLNCRFGICLDAVFEDDGFGDGFQYKPNSGYDVYIDEKVNEPFFSRKSISKKPHLMFDLGLFVTRHDNYQKEGLTVRPFIQTMYNQDYYTKRIIKFKLNDEQDTNILTDTLTRWEKPAVERGDYLRYYDYKNFSYFINKYRNLYPVISDNLNRRPSYVEERFVLKAEASNEVNFYSCILDEIKINDKRIMCKAKNGNIDYSKNLIDVTQDYDTVGFVKENRFTYRLYSDKLSPSHFIYYGDNEGIWKVPPEEKTEAIGNKYLDEDNCMRGKHITVGYWNSVVNRLNKYVKRMRDWLKDSTYNFSDNDPNPILNHNIYWGSAEFLHRQGEHIISQPKRESITYHTYGHWYGYEHSYLSKFTHDQLRRTIKYITHNNLKQNYWEILNRMQKYDDETGMIDPVEFFATHDYLRRYKHEELERFEHKQISSGDARKRD